MSLTAEQRRRLVDVLLRVPPAATFEGRTALLGDALDLGLNRHQGNARLDLELIVRQLAELRADDRLATLIENALEYARGTGVGSELEALLQAARSSPAAPPSARPRDRDERRWSRPALILTAGATLALAALIAYRLLHRGAEDPVMGAYDCWLDEHPMKSCAIRRSSAGERRLQIDPPDSDDHAVVVQYDGPFEPSERTGVACVRVALRQRLTPDVGAPEEGPGGTLDLCQIRGGGWEGTWESKDSIRRKAFRMRRAASPSP